MNIWCPYLRSAWIAGTQSGHGQVDGLGGSGGVGNLALVKRLVHIAGDLGSQTVIDRPEGGDDMPVARDLECRGEVDSFVGQLRRAGERLAGGEEGEVGAG